MSLDLDALEKIAREATPGPWVLDVARYETEYGSITDYGIKDVASLSEFEDSSPWHMACYPLDAEDAGFIATFNPVTALALIAEVRELRQALSAEGQAIVQATVHASTAIGGLQLSVGEQMVKMGYEGLTAERDALQAKLDKVREVIESEKHYTEACGWDVPVIRLNKALGGDAE